MMSNEVREASYGRQKLIRIAVGVVTVMRHEHPGAEGKQF